MGAPVVVDPKNLVGARELVWDLTQTQDILWHQQGLWDHGVVMDRRPIMGPVSARVLQLLRTACLCLTLRCTGTLIITSIFIMPWLEIQRVIAEMSQVFLKTLVSDSIRDIYPKS